MQNFGVPRRALVTGANENSPVNWQRGLYRVWLLVSIAWILAWTIELILNGIEGNLKTAGDFLEIPVLLLGPPAAIFVLAIAAEWAFRGFRVDDAPSLD
jgi:hypothetical protein